MRDFLTHALVIAGATTTLGLLAWTHPRGRTLIRRGFRTGKAIARDPRIPRAWRWALLAAFVLPIPGEFDELLGLLILAAMWPRYGHVIRSTWASTATA